MQTVMRRPTLAAVLTLCVLVGACSGENPAGPAVVPAAPLLEGGVTFGSGGRTTPETNHNTTTAADTGSTAISRGGVTFGSGG